MSLSGVLNINKPEGFTSHDVVSRVRRILRVKRVGHTGTLDPFATGVLLTAVGKATRLIEYSSGWDKEYETVFRLGVSSDTDDVTGELKEDTNQKSKKIDREQILSVLNNFVGDIEQLPPAYSAKKIKGVRSYKLARAGKSPRPALHRVKVYSVDLLDYNYPLVSLRITCSSGTYIRSIARDLGNLLGTSAIVERLVRTRVGNQNLEEAVDLDGLGREGAEQKMLPAKLLVKSLPAIVLSEDNVAQFINGQTVGEKEVAEQYNKKLEGMSQEAKSAFAKDGNRVAVFDSSSTLLVGVAAFDADKGVLRPNKVLR